MTMEVLDYFCQNMTEIQRDIAKWELEHGYLYGIGTAMGRTVKWPLVSRNGASFYVIDECGYTQVASTCKRRGINDLMNTYNYEVKGK